MKCTYTSTVFSFSRSRLQGVQYVVHMYQFSFTPSVTIHTFTTEQQCRTFTRSIRGTCTRVGGTGNKHIYVRHVQNTTQASKMHQRNRNNRDRPLDITTSPFDTDTVIQYPDIIFQKLNPNNYVYFPNFQQHQDTVRALGQSVGQRQVQELQSQIATAEQVTLTKELDRTEIFYIELIRKVGCHHTCMVGHEYGSNKK